MKIFKRVHCKAYLRKYSDGVALHCMEVRHTTFGEMEDPVTGSSWDVDRNIKVVAAQNYYEDGTWKIKDLADLSNFEGDSVEKKYRKRIEEEFDGFLVGVTRIITSAKLGTDYNEQHIHAGEFGSYDRYYHHLFKDPTYTKVGVVYFKNNAKRYVLLDDIEDIGEIGSKK